MPERIQICMMCSRRTGSATQDDSEPSELDEIEDVLCGRCNAAVELRYARPAHARGRPTLGDRVFKAFLLFCATLGKQDDPDLREVLPGLKREAWPVRVRSRRANARLAAALEWAGGPAFLTVPARQR